MRMKRERMGERMILALTTRQRQTIENLAAAHKMSMSGFVRYVVDRYAAELNKRQASSDVEDVDYGETSSPPPATTDSTTTPTDDTEPAWFAD